MKTNILIVARTHKESTKEPRRIRDTFLILTLKNDLDRIPGKRVNLDTDYLIDALARDSGQISSIRLPSVCNNTKTFVQSPFASGSIVVSVSEFTPVVPHYLTRIQCIIPNSVFCDVEKTCRQVCGTRAGCSLAHLTLYSTS